MWTFRTIALPIAIAEPARAACHVVDDGGHPYETFAELGLFIIEE